MAERPRTKALTPEEIMALPDGTRVVVEWDGDARLCRLYHAVGEGDRPAGWSFVVPVLQVLRSDASRRADTVRVWHVGLTKPLDIDAACAGHPAAERQLRALRAVVAWAGSESLGHSGVCLCYVCAAIAELAAADNDAADAAARGGVMTEWQPVVGGRAWWTGEPVLVCEFGPDGSVMIVSAESDIEDNREFWVQLADLREHPDDARHRRLLEAVREYFEAIDAWTAEMKREPHSPATGPLHVARDMEMALRAIVAEIDQAEADHAS